MLNDLIKRRKLPFDTGLLDDLLQRPGVSDIEEEEDPFGMDTFMRLQRNSALLSADPMDSNGEISTLKTPKGEFDNTRVTDLGEILSKGSQELDMLRKHAQERPREEEFAPSGGKRLLASLLGGLEGFSSGSAAKGAQFGKGILDLPYQRASREWEQEGKGLSDLADISDKEMDNRVRVAGMETASEDRKLRVQEMHSAAEQRHEEALARIEGMKDEHERKVKADAEDVRHNKEVEELRKLAGDGGKDPKYYKVDEEDAEGNVTQSLLTAEEFRSRKGGIPKAPGVHERERISQAKRIRVSLQGLTGEVERLKDKLGPLKGHWQKYIAQPLGIDDPELRSLFTTMQSAISLLPILHGYRGGIQAHRQFEEAVGGLHTNPKALKKAFEGLDKIAKDIIEGNTKYGEIEEAEKDEGIPEYETDPKTGELVLKKKK